MSITASLPNTPCAEVASVDVVVVVVVVVVVWPVFDLSVPVFVVVVV